MTAARDAVVKAVLVLQLAVLGAACAAAVEKPEPARVVPVDEIPAGALGDWNTGEPIEQLLQPDPSDHA